MVLTANVAACFLFFYNLVDYINARPSTFVESTTAPLSDVTFPMMTICNINQLRHSFLDELDINHETSIHPFSLIMDEYINGRSTNLTNEESDKLRNLEQKLYNRQNL